MSGRVMLMLFEGMQAVMPKCQRWPGSTNQLGVCVVMMCALVPLPYPLNRFRKKNDSCKTSLSCSLMRSLSALGTYPGEEAVLRRLTETRQNRRRTFTFQTEYSSNISMQVPEEIWEKLNQRAQKFVAEFCGDIGDARALVDKILRVTVLNYIPSASGLHWGLGPEFYQKVKGLGSVLECYASPFNASLATFCSPCTLDQVFGSLGPFQAGNDLLDYVLAADGQQTLIIAAPPYTEIELKRCSSRVSDLVSRCSSLSSLLLYPDWSDAEGVRNMFRACAVEQGQALQLSKQKYLLHNFEAGKPFTAPFGSLAFIMGCNQVAEHLLQILACNFP